MLWAPLISQTTSRRQHGTTRFIATGWGVEFHCPFWLYSVLIFMSFLSKVKQSVTGLEWLRGFQEVKVPRFHDNGTDEFPQYFSDNYSVFSRIFHFFASAHSGRGDGRFSSKMGPLLSGILHFKLNGQRMWSIPRRWTVSLSEGQLLVFKFTLLSGLLRKIKSSGTLSVHVKVLLSKQL